MAFTIKFQVTNKPSALKGGKTTERSLLLMDFCGGYFVIRGFTAFFVARFVYVDEHLNFKN